MRIPFFSRPDPLSGLRAILPELPDIEYRSLAERLDAAVKPHLKLIVSPFDQKFLFRARLSPRDRPFSKAADLGYVPANLLYLLKTFGRVNKPGEAMFYASTQPFVACAETARHTFSADDPDGLDLTVSTWRVVEPLRVASLLASPENLNQMRILEGYQGDRLSKREVEQRVRDARKENARLESEFLAQVPREQRQAAIAMLRFFSDEFARLDAEPWHFKLTNYYKDAAFSLAGEIDGFWYESVGYGFQYSNVALTPKAVDQKLRFECASAARMQFDPRTGTAKFRVLQEDVPADAQGTIAWRQGSREEMDATRRVASIRSIADLAEAKLAPDRDMLPASSLSCLGLLVFGKPEAMDAGRLQADLDELHGKCGRKTLILFVGYGKAVPFAGRQELSGGWLFSEAMLSELSQHVAERTQWTPGTGVAILALPIVLFREPEWWSIEFHFDRGLFMDWMRARSRVTTPTLGDFLSSLYRAAETNPNDLMKVIGVLPGNSVRAAGAGAPRPTVSVPVRWRHPGQR